MKYKLCTCLAEKNIDDCLKELNNVKTDLVEHRIDYLEKIEHLDLIYSSFKEKDFIATCRRENCGGKFNGSEEERVGILLSAVELGAKFVDIEIETEKFLIDKIVSFANERNCKVIISMHNFNSTPTFRELLGVMLKERSYGADIGKIVCTASTINDCHNLLDLILEANKIEFPMISFAMGNIGKFSRVSSLLYGAPFTFISHNVKSAPGQFNYEEMISVLKLVGENNED